MLGEGLPNVKLHLAGRRLFLAQGAGMIYIARQSAHERLQATLVGEPVNEITQFLGNLQTERIVAWLLEARIGDLIHNPFFLGGVAAVAVVSLIMKWRGFLVICLGLTGFAYLISYTLQMGTQLNGLNNTNLLVFVGGGAAIIGLVIYLLFIKSE
jgi:hypothetical protein